MPVPSTKTASGSWELTSSITRPAVTIRSGMRNFTAGIERAAEADDGLVLALARDVDAHDQRGRRVLEQFARDGLLDALAVDELHGAGARELAFHAHPHEIGILAVVRHPGGDLRLVGHRHRARIDLLGLPAMGEAAAGEAFAE